MGRVIAALTSRTASSSDAAMLADLQEFWPMLEKSTQHSALKSVGVEDEGRWLRCGGFWALLPALQRWLRRRERRSRQAHEWEELLSVCGRTPLMLHLCMASHFSVGSPSSAFFGHTRCLCGLTHFSPKTALTSVGRGVLGAGRGMAGKEDDRNIDPSYPDLPSISVQRRDPFK